LDSRRSLFKKTLGGAALLATAGAIPVALQSTRLIPLPAAPLRFFSPEEFAVVTAFADRVLAETLPEGLEAPVGGAPGLPGPVAQATAQQPKAPAPQAVQVTAKLDAFLAPLDPASAKELKQLIGLFENGLFSLLGGGPPTPFTKMTPAQQDRHLARWATSRLAVQRTGYQALKRLCCAVYFGSPEVYASVGYPGPPVELVRAVNAARAIAQSPAADGPAAAPADGDMAAAPAPSPAGGVK
jgi:hypothetical protein